MEKMTIKMECVWCGKEHSIVCSRDGFTAWRLGDLCQKAMPELSATEREQLISGICPDCQNKIWVSDDDEEEEEDF